MIAFAYMGSSSVLLFIAAALWGAGFGALPTIISTWLARAEPSRLESIGGLQTGVFQVAVALGAFLGGLLVDVLAYRQPWSSVALPPYSAP